MVRLQAIGNNRNISVSLPQKLIDKLKFQLRGKSMKRSVWIKDAIEMKFADMASNEITDMSLHQIILHLTLREDFSDLEQVRLRDLYEKLFEVDSSGALVPVSQLETSSA